MTNDCKTCPVSTGAHKPAEAVHQIDEPQAEALRLADECEESATHWVHEIDTRAKAAKVLRAQHARIAELEQRLEIDPRHRYDGISARDATIAAQDERIDDLESQLEAIGAGGVESLRGNTAGGARCHDAEACAMGQKPCPSPAACNQIAAAPQAAAPVPDERAAFEAWLGIKPCGAAHDFGWAAWQARAALAATQPAAQGMDAFRALYESVVHCVDNDLITGRALEAIVLVPACDFFAAQAKQGGF